MWLMTQHGFFSIVRNSQNEGEYFVRGRIRNDLENVRRLKGWEDREVLEWLNADYRYRLIVSREEMLDLVSRMAEEIDYSNFKGRIHDIPNQAEKSTAYARVWGILEALQRAEIAREGHRDA